MMEDMLQQESERRGRWPHRWLCRWRGHRTVALSAEWHERTESSDWYVQTDDAGAGCSRCGAAWIRVSIIPSTDERPVYIDGVCVVLPR